MSNRPENRLARKRSALALGRRGELLAALLLLAKGYRVCQRNFRCKLGEIDIVARKGDLVVFVEVKARPETAEAVDAVGIRAQQRIAKAGNVWIGLQPDAHLLSWRFDVIAVPRFGLPRHFPGVF